MPIAVLDTSFANNPKLRDFLATSPGHVVALTEIAGIQLYTAPQFYEKFKILAEFPKQVIVLKPHDQLRDYRFSAHAMRAEMLELTKTNGFEAFCHRMKLAEQGDEKERSEIERIKGACLRTIDKLIADSTTMPEHFDRIRAGYDARDLRMLKTTGNVSDRLNDKLCQNITLDTAGVFRDHGPWPTGDELFDTWVFRFSTVMHFFVLTKILDGKTPSQPRVLYNHLADINMSTFATYYEGILTADTLLNRVFMHTRDFLDHIDRSRARLAAAKAAN